jgi:excisionase family DNA binding protein
MSTFGDSAMSRCDTENQDRIENSLRRSEISSNGENRYLTVSQLAERLQLSESTIYGWVDRDSIPFLMAGDLLRFDPNAIEAWMIAAADRKREKKRSLHVRVVK